MMSLKIGYIILSCLSLLATTIMAQEPPIYVVNGEIRSEIKSIPPDDIISVCMLDIDDKLIEKYGLAANNGVMVIKLKYDKTAIFPTESSFNEYITSRIEWDDDEEAAHIVFRYKITPLGDVEVTKELTSTNARFKRRVYKALTDIPKWQPATQEGEPVETEGILNILLPEGKQLPREYSIIIR